MYGYVLTKEEEGILISFDFGFEDIGDAINACKAAALDNLYREEYLAEYEKLCFSTLKKEFLKL